MLPHLNSDMEKKTWEKREAYNPHITIVTALFDGRMTGVPHTTGVYDTAYVEKLYRGFQRNLSIPFEFVCLTDKNYYFTENIRDVRFKRSVDQYGWMSLMEMYRPDLCSGNRFTIGLDTIITGPIDNILKSHVSKLAVCTDPYHPHLICNAVTLSTPEFCEEFWGMWNGNEYNLMKECTLFGAPSEMVLLRKYYGNSPKLDTMFPGIVSYKAHIVPMNVAVEDTSIIYFHGHPKPHQVNEEWIRRHWL